MPASAPVRPTARTPQPSIARDERRVGPAGQHRDDRVERGGIGDPQAVDEPRFEPARAQLGVDRPAAAMDDDERLTAPRAHDRRQPRLRIARGVLEQLAAKLQDSGHTHQFSPAVSSKPNATLKFWIAWPAAPFTRLSMHATITSCPPADHPPADVAEVRVRDVLDLRQIRAASAARTASSA